MIYTQITQYDTKSTERQSIELMLNSLTLFITFIPPCLGFYTNYFVSKTFRTNAKKLIQLNLTRCFCQSR